MPTIREVATDAEIETIRALFREYQAFIGIDLSFQGFEAELAGLPGSYAPPTGRMFLAWHAGEPVGCVAVRAFAGPRCEMKRLFVRPAARGLGVGRALVARVIEAGRALGYEEMVLDTLSTMTEALGLYRAFGFHEIPPYRPNPFESACFLGKRLGGD
jgi:ribosomal protein S18 acetylase RimI-like enzyme